MDPDSKSVCIREIQKSMRHSVKALIEDKIDRLGVASLFDVQRDLILSRYGKGLITFQGMQDHTAESIKSLEAFDRAWIEEAQSISKRSLMMLRPTIRKPGIYKLFGYESRQQFIGFVHGNAIFGILLFDDIAVEKHFVGNTGSFGFKSGVVNGNSH